MRFILVISVLAITLSGCNRKESCFEQEDKLVIQKCIDKVIELREKHLSKSCYLVSPYLDTLSLMPYSEEEKKSLLKTLGISEKRFNKAQADILECGDHYEESLMDMSNRNEGYGVFKVNKVYKNLVQIRFTDYYEQVGKQGLKDKAEFRPNQMFEYVCVIKENGDVKIALETASFYD
ncbi:hypothetical protein FGF1_34910 [Flavobacteriaceae bacterium GF1]